MIPFSRVGQYGYGPWWAATQPEEAHMSIDVNPHCHHLVVDDANAAIDFYVAFGAVEMGRVPRQDGKLIHGAVQIDGSLVMLADDFPEMSDGKSMTPKALGGTRSRFTSP
jgi:PhnB protein